MSDDPARAEQEDAAAASPAGSADREDDGPVSTPFDSPYFLPVLLWGFALYFGYDGWFNPEMEWIKFNRYGFGILLAFSLYYTATPFVRLRWALPGMWAGLALWFAFMAFAAEGWWSDSPESITFNQVSCAVSLLFVAWFGLRTALRERAAGAAESSAPRDRRISD